MKQLFCGSPPEFCPVIAISSINFGILPPSLIDSRRNCDTLQTISTFFSSCSANQENGRHQQENFDQDTKEDKVRVFTGASGRKTTSRLSVPNKAYYRDVDQIKADLRSPRHLQRFTGSKAKEDLPGLGQHYCIECAKWFETEVSLVGHRRGKPHKRRFVFSYYTSMPLLGLYVLSSVAAPLTSSFPGSSS